MLQQKERSLENARIEKIENKKIYNKNYKKYYKNIS